jgi:hypothetical protein
MRFRPNEEEDRIQCDICDLIKVGTDNEDVRVYAIANGGYRDIRTAKKLKATGLRPGAADLMLLRKSDAKSFFMEVKTASGSLSKNQRDFRDFCKEAGFPWALVRSRDEAQLWLWSKGLLKPEYGPGPLAAAERTAA